MLSRRLFNLFIGAGFLLSSLSITGQERVPDKLPFILGNLMGTWQAGSTTQFEIWKKSETGTPVGYSCDVSTGDTVVFERLQIFRTDSFWIYRAKVSGQNNEQPVDFRMIYHSRDSVCFENQMHDFPQRLTYKLLNVDSMRVTISAPWNAGAQKYILPYRRISR